jgi:hypothetical protein
MPVFYDVYPEVRGRRRLQLVSLVGKGEPETVFSVGISIEEISIGDHDDPGTVPRISPLPEAGAEA